MKNRIFFFNRTKDLERLLKEGHNKIKYIVLQDYIADAKLANLLRRDEGLEEIKPTDYSEKENFRKLYLSFTGNLNKSNHSVYWWSLNLTQRHPNSSDLSKSMWYLLVLERIIKRENFGILAVFTNNQNLISQMRIWHKNSESVTVEGKVHEKRNILEIINMIFPVKVVLIFLRSLFYKILSSLVIALRPDPKKSYTVIRTIFNHQSFVRDGKFKDTYFKDLIGFLRKKKKDILFFGSIPHPFFVNLKKLLWNKKDFIFILTEQAISFSYIFRTFRDSLVQYFSPLRPLGKTVIEGLDFRFILEKTIADECKTQRFFANIITYYSTKALIKKLNIERIIFPFENRGWEKLAIIASRESKIPIKTVGYQHSSFSSILMNFYIGDEERDIMPLPDMLVTTGSIPKKILKENLGFPESILKVGCGLRQAKSNSVLFTTKKRKKIRNILVALGLTPEEYIKGLIFLNEAFKEDKRFSVTVRPHPYPVISIEKALLYVPDLSFSYKLDKRPSIRPSLEEADLLLYFSSTVGFESLMRGMPIINLDPGFYIGVDPLFTMSDFKWVATSPSELRNIIRDIENLSDSDYDFLKNNASRYVNDYIYPATEENMEVFLN